MVKIDVCDYDYNDYMNKKKELVEIIYKLKREEHMNSQESQSWNDYKNEELEEER